MSKSQSRLGVTLPREFTGLKLEILHPVNLHFNGMGDERHLVFEVEEFGGKDAVGLLGIAMSKISNLTPTYDTSLIWANNPQCTVENSFSGVGGYIDTSNLFFNILYVNINIPMYGKMKYAVTLTCNTTNPIYAAITCKIWPLAKANATVIQPQNLIERITLNNDPA